MKRAQLIVVLLGCLTAPFLASAQNNYDMGKSVYLDNCASCHGATGKGDGPMRAYLIKAPGDLTTITQRNHGTWMPNWGMHRGGPEWHVQQKISALVDYLARMQVR